MKMNLELASYSPKTQESYIMHVKIFANHLKKSPVLLGNKEIREYFHYLITVKNLSTSYVYSAYSAIKFLYETTLDREWNFNKIPRAKKEKKLPAILSMNEVKKIFDVTTNLDILRQ